MILWHYFKWRWLCVRVGWWSALVLWGLRSRKRAWIRMRKPSRAQLWLWNRIGPWNERRTAAVLQLTKRGRWMGGTAHPVQERLQGHDLKRNPEWWRG